ncbi:MAG TPA: lysoplasmalogenase family protein [Candidatus Izemoplasmatales bacterium]|nr:lysoplasmalogenase family protein [Bacillota bacterium]HRY77575.1 lysoplasmalogenase family protein [Candidatus Izemoplasmatales bacterium]
MTSKQKIPLVLFLAAEAFLYWDMMSLDLLEPGSWFQYLSILLCLAFLLVFPLRTRGWITVTAGLIFACLADFFLVVLQKHQLAGTLIFVFAQVAFAARLFWEDWSRRGRFGAIRVLLFVALESVGMVVVGHAFDGLVFAALMYFSLLLGNVIHAFVLWKKHPLFALGLVLLVFCDLAIGFSMAGPYLAISESSIIGIILNSGINWAWLFYLPAQVLITLSVYSENRKEAPIVHA